MADWADLAVAEADIQLAATLSTIQHAPETAVSLSECEECGNAIPKRRQRAVVGVRLCVECQAALERMSR